MNLMNKSKHFLNKFHKCTDDGFGIATTWKTRNIRSLFHLQNKNDYKPALTIKEIVLLVHAKLVKPNATQKLSGMNIMILLKVQNHRCNTKIKSTTVLHGLH